MKLELTISDLSHDGRGVARYKDKVYFVEGALPGDRVLANVHRSKRKFAEAITVKRLDDSIDRVEPPCPHFYRCGGCQLQDYDLHAQQLWKKERTSGAFERAGISVAQVDFVASEDYHYRRRAKISLKPAKHGLLMGFREAHSAEIIPITQCPVLSGPMAGEAQWSALFELVKRFPERKKLGHIIYLDIKPQALVVVFHHAHGLGDWPLAAQEFTRQHHIAVWHKPGHDVAACVSGDSDAPWYALEQQGITLMVAPDAFLQANGAINELLVNAAMEQLMLGAEDRLVDAYCGVGNFALPAARVCEWVTGFDVVDASIERAKANADQLGLVNTQWIKADLSKPSHKFQATVHDATKMVLDPGRAGAADFIQNNEFNCLQRIAYVSCELSALVRDSALLLARGFVLDHVTVFDMFPQTTHQETLAIFHRG